MTSNHNDTEKCYPECNDEYGHALACPNGQFQKDLKASRPSPAGWEQLAWQFWTANNFHKQAGHLDRFNDFFAFIKEALAKRDAELVEKVSALKEGAGIGKQERWTEYDSGYRTGLDDALRLLKGE